MSFWHSFLLSFWCVASTPRAVSQLIVPSSQSKRMHWASASFTSSFFSFYNYSISIALCLLQYGTEQHIGANLEFSSYERHCGIRLDLSCISYFWMIASSNTRLSLYVYIYKSYLLMSS